MFEWSYTYEDDYGWGTSMSYEPCSLDEAIEAVEGKNDATITTAIGEVDVYTDGQWLMTREEAEALAEQEKQAKTNAEAAAKAERAAEAATLGDNIDKANITFILSIARKYPARDNGAQRAAEEIGRHEDWHNKHQSWKQTEEDVVHLPSGREYHIDMWRGERHVTRKLLK